MKVAALTLAAAIASAGCATKEVTLRTVDAAAAEVSDASAEMVRFPVPFCLSFVDSTTAETCMICYDEWGAERSRVCKPPPPKCVARDDPSMTRCLYCDDAPSVSRACLKCEPPPGPGACITCQWSDNAAACKRCPDASGVLGNLDCDGIRQELRQP